MLCLLNYYSNFEMEKNLKTYFNISLVFELKGFGQMLTGQCIKY